jgi:hypothetical protein
MRQRLRIILLLFLLQPLSGRISYSQNGGTSPLNWSQILQLWQEESSNRLPKNRTRQLVEEHGVDFALDAALEQELRRRNFSEDLIKVIRSQVNIAVLTIQCEPVDCTVAINKVNGGESPTRTLTKSVTAGDLEIEVRAPGRETMSDRITVTPGQYVTRRFQLEPLKGSLIVNCEPAECVLLLNGVPRGTISRRTWEVNALVSDSYAVEVRADGYKTKSVNARVTAPGVTSINLELDVDLWARLTAPELRDRMVASIGNALALKGASVSRNSGRMTIKGYSSNPGSWNAQVVESVASNKQRWDFKMAGKSWSVIFDGLKAVSKGDKKFPETPYGQELEEGIQQFSKLRLPAILPAIQNGFSFRKGGTESASILIAESSTDRYTFRLNESYLPQTLLHEQLAVPQSREEMEYGDYRQIHAGLRMPHTMILRYPDRPNQEQILEFDKMDLDARLKESIFKP